MRTRAILLSLPVIAAIPMYGCGSENTYNIPADESKEAAAIGAGTPQNSRPASRRKVTKPPGVPPRDAKNMQPRD
jgi:hypothetical protein